MTVQKLTTWFLTTTNLNVYFFPTNVSITSDYVNAYVSPNFYVIDNVNNLKDLTSNCSFEQHILMVFNYHKFKCLYFSTNVSITSDYVNAYVSPNFYVIDNVNNLQDLTSNCSFEQHIIELCKRCTGLCGWILRTFSSRESTVMMTLFKSLVLPRLDYGSQLWSPTKIHQIIMIGKIQKAFTKHIKGFSSFSYQERLSNLKIYSIQCSRERYIIIYVWKILENLVPNLVKPLQFYVSDRRGCLCSVSHARLGHFCFCIIILQDPSRVFCGRDAR